MSNTTIKILYKSLLRVNWIHPQILSTVGRPDSATADADSVSETTVLMNEELGERVAKKSLEKLVELIKLEGRTSKLDEHYFLHSPPSRAALQQKEEEILI